MGVERAFIEFGMAYDTCYLTLFCRVENLLDEQTDASFLWSSGIASCAYHVGLHNLGGHNNSGGATELRLLDRTW